MTWMLALLVLVSHPDAWLWCVEEYGAPACRELSEAELVCAYESDGRGGCGEGVEA